MSEGERRLALKVDCDTYLGTARAVPALLRLFDRFSVRATFFFVLGPDRSGRAVARVLAKRGVVRRAYIWRARAFNSWRTALYGTVLPAPRIGRRCATLMRTVVHAGHEVALRGWDRVRWAARVDRMSEHEIARELGAAHDEFERVFGRRALASAAPAWKASAASLLVQERYGMLYASDTRGEAPFVPQIDGRTLRTIQVPTTLPPWEESLDTLRVSSEAHFVEFYRAAVTGSEVHAVRAELEGTVLLPLFERQLAVWVADGVRFTTLEQRAREALAMRERLPVRRIVRTTVPGRADEVTASEL